MDVRHPWQGAAVAALCVTMACFAEPKAKASGTRSFPSCAGQFCFSGELLTDAELVSQYGAGFSAAGIHPYHCYEADPGGPFVRFRSDPGQPHEVLDIFLSDRLSCPAAAPPSRLFGRLAVNGGLNLGDGRERVVKLYGEPDREGPADDLEMVGPERGKGDPQPFGDTELVYFATAPETLHTIIFLRNGMVSAFLISRFP